MYDDLKKQLQDYAAGTMRDDDAELAFDALEAIEKLEHKVFILEGDREGLIAQIPRWIPVTERLPEGNALCIVYNKDYGPMVGWRVDGERFRIPGSHFPDHPTHWMPLPEPPKELTGTDMRGGIRRDDAGNVIDWGITGPPGDAGKTEEE